jgi:hypothetical protein
MSRTTDAFLLTSSTSCLAHFLVQTSPSIGEHVLIWDTGQVTANISLNIPYGGPTLASDTDYAWTITWWDTTGSSAAPVTGLFSTSLFDASAWKSAQWLTAQNHTSDNIFRATVQLSTRPVRSRLYLSGLGYHRSTVNGHRVSQFELGSFTTFQVASNPLYSIQQRPSCSNLPAL